MSAWSALLKVLCSPPAQRRAVRVAGVALLTSCAVTVTLPSPARAQAPSLADQRAATADYVPSDKAVRKRIYVSAVSKPCMGMIPMMCLQIRAHNSDPWQLLYAPIVGFRPAPGIEYRLRVLVDEVPNPPADASSQRWFLDRVLERRRVQSP
jgi:hypothetical protein